MTNFLIGPKRAPSKPSAAPTRQEEIMVADCATIMVADCATIKEI